MIVDPNDRIWRDCRRLDKSTRQGTPEEQPAPPSPAWQLFLEQHPELADLRG